MVLVAIYLALNVVVIAVSLGEVFTHASTITDWWAALTTAHGDPLIIVGISLVVFPRLALGLSGFETGVAVMPQIKGAPDDDPNYPRGRIRGTGRLLGTAAIIMSVFLITSSFTTTLLIPQKDFQPGGPANGRALAYLAHEIHRQRLRHGLRHQHDPHPVVRRRVRDGGPAQPGAALPAALRHGTPVVSRGSTAGARLHGDRIRHHAGLRRQCGCAGRRVRDRRAGAHHLRVHRCDAVRPAQAPAQPHDRVRGHLGGLHLHDDRQHDRTARRSCASRVSSSWASW